MAFTITRIPERYRPGLGKIGALPESVIFAIADALEVPPPSTNLGELRAAIEKVPGVATDDAEAITVCLYSLYVLLANSEVSVSEFVNVLFAAMQASGLKALTIADEKKIEYTGKLTRLLSLKTLERASKIEQLRNDQLTSFHDAKIITDIRPVFDNPAEAPVGVMIQHTLKIVFHEAGDHKELYLALASDDISVLKKIAERAEVKQSSLNALMESKHIQNFSLRGD